MSARRFLITLCGAFISLLLDLNAAPLHPDLVVEIYQPTQQTVNGQPVLKFSTWTINMGAGPIELRGTRTSETTVVHQRIKDSDGVSYTDVETGTFTVINGRIRFTDSADYFLREIVAGDGVGGIVSANEKVAYCFVDSFQVTTRPLPPGTPAARVYGGTGAGTFPACGDVLGTSVGWVDEYPVHFSGQLLPLAGVSSGQYWLENILDPLNRIVESNDANNDKRIKVTVETGFFAEINLLGNGETIGNGDETPGSSDHTDFGYADPGSAAVTRTFTIQNSGTGSLSLFGVPTVQILGSGDFVISTQPASPVAATSGSTTFQITFTPSGLGSRSATAVIANNDSDEGPYLFAIVGNADADGDGMADGWEALHNVSDPAADDDGDGFSNYEEYVAGTSPRDATSRLAIKAVQFVEGEYRISFDSLSGRIYRVDYRNGFAGSWEMLEQRTGDGSPMMIRDPNAGGELQRFYRLAAGF